MTSIPTNSCSHITYFHPNRPPSSPEPLLSCELILQELKYDLEVGKVMAKASIGITKGKKFWWPHSKDGFIPRWPHAIAKKPSNFPSYKKKKKKSLSLDNSFINYKFFKHKRLACLSNEYQVNQERIQKIKSK